MHGYRQEWCNHMEPCAEHADCPGRLIFKRNQSARFLIIGAEVKAMKKVGIVMGSASDLPGAEKAMDVLPR